MDKELLKTKRAAFDGIDDLKAANLPYGRFSVEINGGNFECLFVPKAADYLFVILHGARDPRNSPLPVFQRWSWHDLFPGSVLYVSDPTLFLDPERMGLGWYLGTQYTNHLDDLALLVEAVAVRIGVASTHIITYGSSGGGFAALMVASRIEGCTAVSINAQTNVLSYMKEFVDNLLRLAFGGRNAGELSADELLRFDAVKAFVRARAAKCLYVQNVRDIAHFKRHFLPFCHATHAPRHGGLSQDRRIITYLYDDPTGHGAEPKALVPALVEIAVRLAEGAGLQELGDQVRQSGAAAVSACELSGLDRGLAQRVERAVSRVPESVGQLAMPTALILVQTVFEQIAREVARLGVNNTVNVCGLGAFYSRAPKLVKGNDKASTNVVRFTPNVSIEHEES